MRRWLASLICPDMAKEAERWFFLRQDISTAKDWLGHDFPMVQVALDRLTIGDANRWRALDEPALEHKYQALGYFPTELNSFREKMRQTFGTFPYEQSEKGKN